MERLFLIGLIRSGGAISAAGRKLNESQAPVTVKTAFETKSPGIKAHLTNEDANYESNFKQNGKTMSSIINKNGTIVGMGI